MNKIVGIGSKLITHPLTSHLSIDSPNTILFLRKIIQGKPFLRQIYIDWYEQITNKFLSNSGTILELGTGGGFLSDFMPNLITSDIIDIKGTDLAADAHYLPFADESLAGIVIVNVFHHLAKPRRFINESLRTIQTSGKLIMIEPWVTRFSSLVYKHLHHENFDSRTDTWGHDGKRRLSDANGALPWIIFERDRKLFNNEFPRLQINTIDPIMPFRYLLSGGVSTRINLPIWLYPIAKQLESWLSPWIDSFAMFAKIELEKL